MAPSGEAGEPARASRAFGALAAERGTAQPLSRETGRAAGLGRTAKAAGASAGPSTRRPARARFAVGAGARPSRPAPPRHAAHRRAPSAGRRPLGSQPRPLRVPGPVGPSPAAQRGERCLVTRGTRKFENEGEK